MPKYLTPQQYWLADDGMNNAQPPTLALQTLARYIQRAEVQIDTFLGFDLRLGGFEPHTAWIQSQWDYRTLKTRIPDDIVPLRQALRYRIQVSNVSAAGAGFFATINPGDVAYNTFGGYVEIVPLQSVTYAMTPVLVDMGLRPPVVQLDYEVGYYLGVTGDTLYDTGDHTTYRALRGFWATTYDQALSIQPNTLPPIPAVVYVNGSVVASSNYTINATEGTVTFTTAQATTATVTADYTYTIPDAVMAATIAQTSFLFGQRDFNLAGMSGVEMSKNDHQTIRRITKVRGETNEKIMLAPMAKEILEPYLMVAVQ